MRRWIALPALLGFCLPAFADSYPEAREWLQRMAESMREMTYQGTFVYVRGQDVETLRITHVRDSDGVRERLVALSGPHREIIRDHEGVRCVLGEDASLPAELQVVESVFPEIPIEELAKARDRYWFEVGKKGRIAGHRGLRISIMPRDEFRYGYDLWLEESTGLLLRWVLFDASRRALAKLMFTDLAIGDAVDAAELATDTPSEAFVRLTPRATPEPEPSAPPSHWAPGDMPPGFRLAARSRSSEAAGAAAEHLVYSDGLASVSVYIEPVKNGQKVEEGLSRLGTTNAFSRNAGNRLVTAIGEVPVVTVQAIGNAFAGFESRSD